MKKYLLSVLLLFFGIIPIYAQFVYSSDTFYNKGLEEFNNKHFKQADSLFSLSIDVFALGDAYMSRAIARKNLGDLNGYCEDIYYAIKWGNKDFKNRYIKNCCTIDTVYYDSLIQKIDSNNYFRKEIIEKRNYSSFSSYSIYDKDKKLILSYQIENGDTFYSGGEMKIGEFPGGEKELINFLRNNIKYPVSAKEIGLQGTVYVSFILNEEGIIINKKILRGLSKKLNETALSIIDKMPQWKPASYKNRPVKSVYNLPIKFVLKY